MTRFFIVNTDYPGFLESLYASHPGLADEPFARQLAVRNATRFGVSDFYPRNLEELGHPAFEAHLNNEPLQRAWARERRLQTVPASRLRVVLRRGIVPWIVRDKAAWMGTVLAAQIEEFRPDVILTHALCDLPPEFWKRIKGAGRLLVGQVASPLSDDVDLSSFDLILSSLPSFVARFRRRGLRSELFRLAFEPRLLSELGPPGHSIPVSFVGSLSPHHVERLAWLEHLCRAAPIRVWGQGIEDLPESSPIRAAYQGPAWGIEMFRVLRRSRISVNFHIGISGPHANNMRLYETTGVETLLLTDAKADLSDLFEPNVEAAVFHTHQDCAERIRYYLEHEPERAAMARAGHERTLRDHTYRQRMAQLVELVEPLL